MSKAERTSSYRGQEAYDRFVSNCDISSLRFLSEKYEDELDYFKKNNDLSIPENFRVYKDKQQIKKIIDEELTKRLMDESATITNNTKTYFDSEMGQVIDEVTGEIVAVAEFDENEEYVTVRNFDGDIINQYDGGELKEKERTRKEVYDGWEY